MSYVCQLLNSKTQKPCKKSYKFKNRFVSHYNEQHAESGVTLTLYLANYVAFANEDKTNIKAQSNSSILQLQQQQQQLPQPQQEQQPQQQQPILLSSVSNQNIKREFSPSEDLSAKVYKLEVETRDMSKRLKIIEEKLKTKNVKKCVICWKKERNYILIPCGHYMLCGSCALMVLSGSKDCPYCKNSVYDMQQVFDNGIEDLSE